MTVAELIELLKKTKQDQEVSFYLPCTEHSEGRELELWGVWEGDFCLAEKKVKKNGQQQPVSEQGLL